MTATDHAPDLRTLNFQYAALKRVADVVKDGMAHIKEQHLQALLEEKSRTNSNRWVVDVDGKDVAVLSLAGGKSKPVIVSESALIEWATEQHPEMVETRPRLTEQARGILDALVADYVDGTPVTKDGEVIPGVEEGHGSVYQSLRFKADKHVDGKREMDQFLQELGVAGLIEDVVNGGEA